MLDLMSRMFEDLLMCCLNCWAFLVISLVILLRCCVSQRDQWSS